MQETLGGVIHQFIYSFIYFCWVFFFLRLFPYHVKNQKRKGKQKKQSTSNFVLLNSDKYYIVHLFQCFKLHDQCAGCSDNQNAKLKVR